MALLNENSCSELAGLDLYDDLLTDEGIQRQQSCDELHQKYTDALAKITDLEQQLVATKTSEEKHKQRAATLAQNLSNLLVTAKAEVQRKDRIIRDLRSRSTAQRHSKLRNAMGTAEKPHTCIQSEEDWFHHRSNGHTKEYVETSGAKDTDRGSMERNQALTMEGDGNERKDDYGGRKRKKGSVEEDGTSSKKIKHDVNYKRSCSSSDRRGETSFHSERSRDGFGSARKLVERSKRQLLRRKSDEHSSIGLTEDKSNSDGTSSGKQKSPRKFVFDKKGDEKAEKRDSQDSRRKDRLERSPGRRRDRSPERSSRSSSKDRRRTDKGDDRSKDQDRGRNRDLERTRSRDLKRSRSRGLSRRRSRSRDLDRSKSRDKDSPSKGKGNYRSPDRKKVREREGSSRKSSSQSPKKSKTTGDSSKVSRESEQNEKRSPNKESAPKRSSREVSPEKDRPLYSVVKKVTNVSESEKTSSDLDSRSKTSKRERNPSGNYKEGVNPVNMEKHLDQSETDTKNTRDENLESKGDASSGKIEISDLRQKLLMKRKSRQSSSSSDTGSPDKDSTSKSKTPERRMAISPIRFLKSDEETEKDIHEEQETDRQSECDKAPLSLPLSLTPKKFGANAVCDEIPLSLPLSLTPKKFGASAVKREQISESVAKETLDLDSSIKAPNETKEHSGIRTSESRIVSAVDENAQLESPMISKEGQHVNEKPTTEFKLPLNVEKQLFDSNSVELRIHVSDHERMEFDEEFCSPQKDKSETTKKKYRGECDTQLEKRSKINTRNSSQKERSQESIEKAQSSKVSSEEVKNTVFVSEKGRKIVLKSKCDNVEGISEKKSQSNLTKKPKEDLTADLEFLDYIKQKYKHESAIIIKPKVDKKDSTSEEKVSTEEHGAKDPESKDQPGSVDICNQTTLEQSQDETKSGSQKPSESVESDEKSAVKPACKTEDEVGTGKILEACVTAKSEKKTSFETFATSVDDIDLKVSHSEGFVISNLSKQDVKEDSIPGEDNASTDLVAKAKTEGVSSTETGKTDEKAKDEKDEGEKDEDENDEGTTDVQEEKDISVAESDDYLISDNESDIRNYSTSSSQRGSVELGFDSLQGLIFESTTAAEPRSMICTEEKEYQGVFKVPSTYTPTFGPPDDGSGKVTPTCGTTIIPPSPYNYSTCSSPGKLVINESASSRQSESAMEIDINLKASPLSTTEVPENDQKDVSSKSESDLPQSIPEDIPTEACVPDSVDNHEMQEEVVEMSGHISESSEEEKNSKISSSSSDIYLSKRHFKQVSIDAIRNSIKSKLKEKIEKVEAEESESGSVLAEDESTRDFREKMEEGSPSNSSDEPMAETSVEKFSMNLADDLELSDAESETDREVRDISEKSVTSDTQYKVYEHNAVNMLEFAESSQSKSGTGLYPSSSVSETASGISGVSVCKFSRNDSFMKDFGSECEDGKFLSHEDNGEMDTELRAASCGVTSETESITEFYDEESRLDLEDIMSLREHDGFQIRRKSFDNDNVRTEEIEEGVNYQRRRSSSVSSEGQESRIEVTSDTELVKTTKSESEIEEGELASTESETEKKSTSSRKEQLSGSTSRQRKVSKSSNTCDKSSKTITDRKSDRDTVKSKKISPHRGRVSGSKDKSSHSDKRHSERDAKSSEMHNNSPASYPKHRLVGSELKSSSLSPSYTREQYRGSRHSRDEPSDSEHRSQSHRSRHGSGQRSRSNERSRDSKVGKQRERHVSSDENNPKHTHHARRSDRDSPHSSSALPNKDSKSRHPNIRDSYPEHREKPGKGDAKSEGRLPTLERGNRPSLSHRSSVLDNLYEPARSSSQSYQHSVESSKSKSSRRDDDVDRDDMDRKRAVKENGASKRESRSERHTSRHSSNSDHSKGHRSKHKKSHQR